MQHMPYVMGFECDELRVRLNQMGKEKYIEELKPAQYACLTLKQNSIHLE